MNLLFKVFAATALCVSVSGCQSNHLTKAQRDRLSEITPGTTWGQCAISGFNSASTWNDQKLWWECDDNPKHHGPKAILPIEAAEAAADKRREDAMWCDPHTNLGMGTWGKSYRCTPNENGPAGRKGRWEEDVEGERQMQKYDDDNLALGRALSTRVLTKEEMQAVAERGISIYARSGEFYNEDDLQRKYARDLTMQMALRMAAEK